MNMMLMNKWNRAGGSTYKCSLHV